MQENLIAPCGMNCGLCSAYLFQKNDCNKHGFHRTYCPGCIPRGKNCLFMRDACHLIGEGKIRFCFLCQDYPCKRLKSLDKRYRTKYHMSMIDNLNFIKENGIDAFLEKQKKQWQCPTCGDMICCHNGLCLHCDIEKLVENRRYRWDEANKYDKKGEV